MTPQLIAIDATALQDLLAEVRELKAIVQDAKIQPEPNWLTIKEYAARVGKSESTVNRWIASGEIEAKTEGKTRMVRV
jgi:excisionase family DNA binding protein